MLRIRFILLLALFFSVSATIAQGIKKTGPLPNRQNPAKNTPTQPPTPVVNVSQNAFRIKWKAVENVGLPNGESKKVLNFDGASYTSDFLPLCIEKIPLSPGINSATFALINPVYEALDPASEVFVAKKHLSTAVSLQTFVTIERGVPSAEVRFVPLRLNPSSGHAEKLVSFDLKLKSSTSDGEKKHLSRHNYAPASVLATGTWFRIGVAASGVYKINYAFLKGMGVDMKSVNPQNIQIYGNGGKMLPFQNAAFRYDDLVQNAIYLSTGAGKTTMDSSDYLLFYGQGTSTWSYAPGTPGTNKFVHTVNVYSDTAFYFLTIDASVPSLRVALQPSDASPANKSVNTFDDYAFVEHDSINLIQSGREWYGEAFDEVNSYVYPFYFPNIDTAHVTVRANLVARADGDSTYFKVTCQSKSQLFGTPPVSFATYWADYAEAGTGDLYFKSGTSSFNVTVSKVSPAPNIGWMNYVEVNARRQLIMAGNQMLFRDINSTGIGNVAAFSISGANPRLCVWEVTDPIHVKNQASSFTAGVNTKDFTVAADSLREFVVFDSTASGILLTPTFFGRVPNQNLHATLQEDFIIVAHPLFINEARRLADLHTRMDNLRTVVVTPQQIYNEFSSGKQDVTAIRDFVKMMYDRASGNLADMPKYLLLFGDGSYDPKHRLPGNTNFVVAFENADALNYSDSYVSDAYFGLLDDTEGGWDSGADIGALDIGIGRFPVRTPQSAKDVVDKVEKYVSLGSPPTQTGCVVPGCTVMRDWRNTVCFVADDGDGATHVLQAEQLATMVDTAYNSYNIDKIYLDSYQEEYTPLGTRYPDVNTAITQRVEKGALIFNYTGHGGTAGLSHKSVVDNTMINSWDNLCNMPFFVTATCEFAQYDNPAFVSSGEGILLNPNGAGIGLLTTVRLVFSTPNFNLNQNFYRCAFKPVNGVMPRLGDIYRITQNLSGSLVNNRNFSLLGDPALRLAYPEKTLKTTSFNNTVVSAVTIDTVHALSRVSVKGYIIDSLGNKWNSFNGSVYPTVYDKPTILTTLSNDGTVDSPPITYKLLRNVIFKGKSSVVNGDFQFSFVVPKDIAFQYGPGKISYYFENGVQDGAAMFNQFQVGGVLANAPVDVTGPKIRLFLNDTTFQYGANTNRDPRLYAILFDSSGVNIAGTSIGHDLIAVLDNNSASPSVLNDYYSPDLNTYRSGKITYPYSNLSEGIHTLRLKAWDVYDNSSESVTEFIVASNAPLALNHVLNYPNPFTTHTSFFFEDNECCQTLNVEIAIFTITGKLVKTIETSFNIDGYRSPPIDWDGRDDFGDKIGRGVYVYRLTVRSPSGGASEKLEKLVILN